MDGVFRVSFRPVIVFVEACIDRIKRQVVRIKRGDKVARTKKSGMIEE